MAPKTSLRPVTREDAAKKAAAAKRAKRTAQVKAQQNQMVEAAEGKAGSSVGDRDRRAKDTFNFMLKNSKGGKVAKKAVGGAMKKKGMAKGGAVAKKMGGGKMMKKGYAKGGKLTKKMGKGGTLVRGTGAQRSGRMARGPMG